MLVTVGTFPVRLAKAFGVRVTGVAGTAKVDLVHALGAGRVINTSAGRPPTGRRYDVIIDASGPPTGGWSSSAPKTGGRWPGGLDRQLRALRPRFAGRPCRTFVTKENSLNVGEFAARIEQGSSPATSRTTRELGARGVHRGPSPHLGGRGRRD